MSITLTEKAVAGRRIIHDHRGRKAQLPGIITRVDPDGEYPGVWVRLDGDRYSLFVPRKFFSHLTFLDEVTEVPALPMGRFTPTADDFGGAWEGVPVFQCESEDIVILTGDQQQADAAVDAFCKDMLIDREFLPAMQARWAVFEWEPEDSEYPWTVSWDASEGDDQAIQIYYLPA